MSSASLAAVTARAARRRWVLLSVTALPLALLGRRLPAHAAGARPVVDLHIASDGDLLAFTPRELSCTAGAHVRLWFHHAGRRIVQEHNWVLVRPGKEGAVEAAALRAGAPHGWLPSGSPDVLAATPMCGPGQTELIEFTAPGPGDYPFICSYPGHGAEMRGVLHVLPAALPPAPPPVGPAPLKSPQSVRTALRIMSQVVDHAGRLIAAANYALVPREVQEFGEGVEALRDAMAGEPADVRSGIEPLLRAALQTSQALSAAARRGDGSAIAAAHRRFGAAVQAVIAAFPGELRPRAQPLAPAAPQRGRS
jgi:azurin